MTPEDLDNLGFQLSHDLKSSLRGICLGLESASEALEKGDTVRLRERLSMAHQSSLKLARLLDGITGLSRASQAKADESIHMKDLVEQVLAEFQDRATAPFPSVELESLPTVQTDSVLILEVWRQLIENALIHGGASSIRIGSIPSDSEHIFFVEDQGSGVPADVQEGLFRAISRGGDRSRVGLGLLFCRRVIQRLGGRIWHEQESGRTSFYFSLPRSAHQSL